LVVKLGPAGGDCNAGALEGMEAEGLIDYRGIESFNSGRPGFAPDVGGSGGDWGKAKGCAGCRRRCGCAGDVEGVKREMGCWGHGDQEERGLIWQFSRDSCIDPLLKQEQKVGIDEVSR
jgi:hypothetical protein